MKRHFFSQQSTTAQRNFSPPPSMAKTYSADLNSCDPLVPTSIRLLKKIKSGWTWSLDTRTTRTPAVRMYTHFGEHTQPARLLYVSARGTTNHFQAKLYKPWLLGYQTNHFNQELSRDYKHWDLHRLVISPASNDFVRGVKTSLKASWGIEWLWLLVWLCLLSHVESKSALLS